MSISVNDPLTGGTYSGLKEVSYRVYSQNILTQEGTLYSFNKSNPKQSDLRSKWTGSITVDSAKNNSNDVRVVVYAKDNAANDSEGVAKLKIDTTAPRIDVSYDNNSADSNSYFKAGRTARIVVTERNFNPDDVVVKLQILTAIFREFPTGQKLLEQEIRMIQDGLQQFHTLQTEIIISVLHTQTLPVTNAAGELCNRNCSRKIIYHRQNCSYNYCKL